MLSPRQRQEKGGTMAKRKLNDPFIRNYSNPEKRTEIYDEHVSGLAVRITPTGHKSFVYRYRIGSKVKRYTIGTFGPVGLADARAKAKELHQLVKDGIDPQKEKTKRKHTPDPKTVSDLAAYFKKRHLPTLRGTTQEDYERIVDNEIVPTFGSVPVEDLHRNQVIEFLEDIAFDRDSPVMSNRIRAVLSSMYSFGMKKAMVDFNPVKTVEPVGEENSRDRVYTDEEIKALWEAFEQEVEPIQSVYKMLLICGQRSGETKRMEWPAINFKDQIWTIQAGQTKGDRKHYVPLPGMAIEVLERLQSRSDSKYVFESTRKPGHPIGWIQKAKERIRKASKVSDFRPHDLRRTVASNLARLGVDRTVNGKVLNHKGMSGDNQVTAVYDRYDYMDEKRQALNRWSALLKQIIEGKTEAKITKMGVQ